MVALASLGIREPDLLLLDEPTRELDAAWLARFERWLANRRAAVLAISHDPAFVSRIFSRVWHLKEGHLENSFSRAPGGDAYLDLQPNATVGGGAGPKVQRSYNFL